MQGEVPLRDVTSAPRRLVVTGFGLGALQKARVLDALRTRAAIEFLDSPSAVIDRLRDRIDAPHVILLADGHTGGRDLISLVRDMLSCCRHAAIVVYCDPVREAVPNVGALAAAGVHQFLFWDVNDSALRLRAIVSAARQQCATDAVMTMLIRVVPPQLHPMVEAALTRPQTVTEVRALADAVGVHRKTLFNRCERLRFLNPTELLIWTRIVLVAYLLETTGATVEVIATELAYPSPTALRNTIKRYTGKRAMEIRERGGARLAVTLLQEQINARHRLQLHLV